MVSPICLINGTSSVDGFDSTPGAVVTIQLASLTGVNTWSLTCVGTDDLQDKDTITSSLSIDYVLKRATFTVPSEATGCSLLFRSVVNNGRDINGRIDGTLTCQFAVFGIGTGTSRLLSVGQTTEGSSSFGWISDLNSILRVSGNFLETSGNFESLVLSTLGNPLVVSGEVSTIAALRALNRPSATTKVYVRGYYAIGDGGDGNFYWSSASTATDNGGSIIQPNAGGTGRWIRIISGVVNVLWFGAKNTGVPADATTNDTAFTNALGAVPSGGGALYIPQGTYYKAASLVIASRSSIQIFGDGPKATTIRLLGQLETPAGALGICGVKLTGVCSHIFIEKLAVIGSGNALDYQTGFGTLRNSGVIGNNIVVSKVEVANCAKGVVFDSSEGNIVGVEVTDGYFYHLPMETSISGDNTGYGIVMGGVTGWQILGCHLDHVDRHSIYISTAGDGEIGGGTRVENHRAGLSAWTSSVPAIEIARSSNVSVNGVHCYNNNEISIAIDGDANDLTNDVRNIVLNGCIFRDNGYAEIVVAGDSATSTIEGVTITGCGFFRETSTNSQACVYVYTGKEIGITDSEFILDNSYSSTFRAIFLTGSGGSSGADALLSNNIVISGNRGIITSNGTGTNVYLVALASNLCTGSQKIFIYGNRINITGPTTPTITGYNVARTSQTIYIYDNTPSDTNDALIFGATTSLGEIGFTDTLDLKAKSSGAINLKLGAGQYLRVTSSGVSFPNTGISQIYGSVTFDVAAPTTSIGIATVSTNSATGKTLTLQGQSASGTTSIGGGITISSGTGTSTAGNVLLQTGGTTKVTVSPTAVTMASYGTGIAHFDSSGVLSSSTIVSADISNSAAIPGSKLDLTSPGAIGSTAPSTGKFTTLQATSTTTLNTSTGVLHSDSGGVVTSSTIVDADVNASAAIASTKLAMTGIVQELRFTIGTSATTSSSTSLTTSMYVISCQVKLTTAYSAGATISIGQTSHVSDFLATTDINPQGTVGDVYAVEQDSLVAANAAVLATVGGSPSVGAAVVIIKYVIPNT